MTRLLLLAGTAEARQVAADLAGEPGMDVVASLAGVTRAPQDLGVPTRVGGFGGRAGFRDWLAREKVTAVLAATHPFAAKISMRGADVCSELGMPYLQLLRHPWLPGEGDRWIFLDRAEEAAAKARAVYDAESVKLHTHVERSSWGGELGEKFSLWSLYRF